MEAILLQINTSRGGVPKLPVPFADAGRLGLEGDGHLYRYHGGPGKALLLIASEAVDALRTEGWPLFYGALGENLTVRGLSYSAWRSGQRFRAGGALIQLTTPRTPCATLNRYGKGIQGRIYDSRVKAGDCSSPKWGLSGFYAAVLQPGRVASSDLIVPLDSVV